MSDDWGNDPWQNPPQTEFTTPTKKKAKTGLLVGLSAVGIFVLVAGGVIVTGLNALNAKSAAPTPTIKVPTPKETVSTEFAENDLYTQPKDMEKFIDAVGRATVRVECNLTDGSGAWGSGWGIDLDETASKSNEDSMPYEVITNWHVVESCLNGNGAISIFFASDPDTGYPAEVVTIDNSFELGTGTGDLALIKTATPVPSLALPKSAPKQGHWALAIGNPADAAGEALTNHVTIGVVSDYLTNKQWVVTTASINHGNSGGPLLNSRGEVIAINTFGDAREGANSLAYSLASNQLCNVVVDCSTVPALSW